MNYKVTAKINNGDSCPKREYRAWNYDAGEFTTLEDAISFLIEKSADGFEIEHDGKVIASKEVSHYS